jgi:hypothetical protein
MKRIQIIRCNEETLDYIKSLELEISRAHNVLDNEFVSLIDTKDKCLADRIASLLYAVSYYISH